MKGFGRKPKVGRTGTLARSAFALFLVSMGLVSAVMSQPVTGVPLLPAKSAQAAPNTCPPGTVYGNVCFPNGAPSFADQTVSFNPGLEWSEPVDTSTCNYTGANPNLPPRGDPNISPLGPPNDQTDVGSGGAATPDSLSLGSGGVLVIKFTNNTLTGSSTNG